MVGGPARASIFSTVSVHPSILQIAEHCHGKKFSVRIEVVLTRVRARPHQLTRCGPNAKYEVQLQYVPCSRKAKRLGLSKVSRSLGSKCVQMCTNCGTSAAAAQTRPQVRSKVCRSRAGATCREMRDFLPAPSPSLIGLTFRSILRNLKAQPKVEDVAFAAPCLPLRSERALSAASSSRDRVAPLISEARFLPGGREETT